MSPGPPPRADGSEPPRRSTRHPPDSPGPPNDHLLETLWCLVAHRQLSLSANETACNARTQRSPRRSRDRRRRHRTLHPRPSLPLSPRARGGPQHLEPGTPGTPAGSSRRRRRGHQRLPPHHTRPVGQPARVGAAVPARVAVVAQLYAPDSLGTDRVRHEEPAVAVVADPRDVPGGGQLT
jgi:hypothetical protein